MNNFILKTNNKYIVDNIERYLDKWDMLTLSDSPEDAYVYESERLYIESMDDWIEDYLPKGVIIDAIRIYIGKGIEK